MTRVGFPDLEARSSDGRTNLTARTPRGADGAPSFLRRTFRYSLTIDGHEMWSRRQPRDEPSPRELWVSDDGWSVVRTHGGGRAGLLVLDPLGRATLVLDVLRDVFRNWAPPGEVRFAKDGPCWAEDVLATFALVDDRRHFLVRTRFGRRFGIDLELRRVLPAGDEALDRQALRGAEERAVLAVVREAAASADRLGAIPTIRQLERGTLPNVLRETSVVRAAARAAGQLGVTEAAPSLRALEAVPLEDGWRRCSPMGDGWTIGVRSLRRTSQLALRRLGEHPAGDAPYRVGRIFADEGPPLVRDREGRSAGLSRRARPDQVLELLGSPDFAYDNAWDYDLARGFGGFFTLRVRFGGGRVSALERVDPPEWLGGHERERDVLS